MTISYGLDGRPTGLRNHRLGCSGASWLVVILDGDSEIIWQREELQVHRRIEKCHALLL